MKLFIHTALLICTNSVMAEQADVSASIKRIENGLTEKLRITGEPVATYSINERLAYHNILGVSIAVTRDNQLLWARAYGMADVQQARKMSTDTLLLAGSISKPIAALRALQLHDEGRFLLDNNINDYLKNWAVPDNEFTQTEKVTLRRILNHSAGLTVWGFPGYDKGDVIPSTIEVLDGKGNTDPVRVYKTPGESWQYSGGGYTIMQLALENLDGSFADSLQQHVLNPLNMQNSTFANPLPKPLHGAAATGYRRDGNEVEGKWPIYPEMAAAGLWTTPSQLVNYATYFQQQLRSKKDGLIRYETAKTMLTPSSGDHGLGPVIQQHTFGHGGADEGFRAQLTAWREHAYGIVVMVNSDNGAIMNEVISAVAAEYGLPGFEPVVRTRITLSVDKIAQYTGTYHTEEFGPVILSIEDGVLNAFAPNIEFRAELYPQSTNEFFEARNGEIAAFTLHEDGTASFSWGGYIGKRSR